MKTEIQVSLFHHSTPVPSAAKGLNESIYYSSIEGKFKANAGKLH